jgi:DNA-binding SARP family transcriptional activator
LAAYKRCKEVLQAELGITPSPKTEALREDILRKDRFHHRDTEGTEKR